jgi:hypothetical protein
MAIQNGNGSKIEAITESIVVRLVARASMVATPLMLAIFGWILVEAWSEQKAFNKLTDARLRSVEDRLLTIEVLKDGSQQGRRRGDLIPPRSQLPAED